MATKGGARTRSEARTDARQPLPPLPPVPQDLEAERLLLGVAMLDASAAREVVPLVPDEAFYRPEHIAIWQALKVALRDHGGCDPVVVRSVLEENGALDRAGGAAHLAEIVASTPSAAFGPLWAGRVMAAWRRRRAVSAALALMRGAGMAKGEAAEDAIREAQRALAAIVAEQAAGVVEHISGPVAEVPRPEPPRRTIGVADLDERVAWGQPGSYIVVGGGPGQGKSCLLRQAAAALASQGSMVVHVSLEESREVVSDGFVAQAARVPVSRLRAGRLSRDEEGRVEAAKRALSSLPLHLVCPTGASRAQWTPEGITSLAEAVFETRPDLHPVLVVDYLQQMEHPGGDTRAERIAETSRILRTFALRRRATVLAAVSLNRNARDSGVPTMGSIRDCGQVEFDATVILMIWHSEEDHESVQRVRIEKNRTGPTHAGIRACFARDRGGWWSACARGLGDAP